MSVVEMPMASGLLFLDVETTGVNADRDIILEASLKTTDMFGVQVDSGCHVLIVPKDVSHMNALMNDDILDMHTRNNLINDVLIGGMPSDLARKKMESYVESAKSMFDTLYIAGYSVSFDRAIMERLFPSVLEGIQHRIIDVTSLNVAMRTFLPDIDGSAWRTTNHRSETCLSIEMDDYRSCRDILESLAPRQ